ncbi:MAG: HDIG domain-containing protein, partial [Muribaculaceae bacterium]|nr:HDIG domain-containing protein [Muribaculaceae bacterium]
MKKIKIDIKKIDLIRAALLLGAVAVILLVLPREDHQSYSYEKGQPWRYQLLTAEVSIPVLPDSATSRRLQDSIERNFIPFVRYDGEVEGQNIERFGKSLSSSVAPHEVSSIISLLKEVYRRGIVDSKTYDRLRNQKVPKVRLLKRENGSNTAETLAAAGMLSPSKAFEFIDSAFNAGVGEQQRKPIEGEMAKALNVCLTPNFVSDPETDGKYRDEAYVLAKGGFGMIQKGERIVDRGQIVDSQIYTNLNTYMKELAKQKEQDSKVHTYFYVGKGLYILIWFAILYLYLALYRKRFYGSEKKMSFLVLFITLFNVFSILMFQYITYGLYLVPFAAIPVIIMVFFDTRTAIFSLVTTIMISALVAVDPLQFIFLELLVGMVAAFSINQLTQRSQLLRTALFTFIAYSVGYIVMIFIRDGQLSNFQGWLIGIFAINAVVLSFTYILILIIERSFGFTSTVTLVELSDINNKLLRKLAEEAPGTFQHSMQVSTLAAEAARAIGANTQLVRTGALYHDIGKMESPIFFTENQHGVNPHSGLNPETSAQKIIS